MRITYSILYLWDDAEIFYRLNGIPHFLRISKEKCYKFENWLRKNPLSEEWPKDNYSHVWVLGK